MIEVDCLVSIKKDGKVFLDPVKIKLLNEIMKSGSLSGAAKKLKISYQHAWTMIDEMNHAAPSPLVIKQHGGANGGGTLISEYGENILKDYKQIASQVNKLVSQINVDINI